MASDFAFAAARVKQDLAFQKRLPPPPSPPPTPHHATGFRFLCADAFGNALPERNLTATKTTFDTATFDLLKVLALNDVESAEGKRGLVAWLSKKSFRGPIPIAAMHSYCSRYTLPQIMSLLEEIRVIYTTDVGPSAFDDRARCKTDAASITESESSCDDSEYDSDVDDTSDDTSNDDSNSSSFAFKHPIWTHTLGKTAHAAAADAALDAATNVASNVDLQENSNNESDNESVVVMKTNSGRFVSVTRPTSMPSLVPTIQSLSIAPTVYEKNSINAVLEHSTFDSHNTGFLQAHATFMSDMLQFNTQHNGVGDGVDVELKALSTCLSEQAFVAEEAACCSPISCIERIECVSVLGAPECSSPRIYVKESADMLDTSTYLDFQIHGATKGATSVRVGNDTKNSSAAEIALRKLSTACFDDSMNAADTCKYDADINDALQTDCDWMCSATYFHDAAKKKPHTSSN